MNVFIFYNFIEFTKNTLKFTNKSGKLRMNFQFVLDQGKQLISIMFLVQFFAANKIYILVFNLKTDFGFKSTVFVTKFKMCVPNFTFSYPKQENGAFEHYNCFGIKNKYVDLVGSKK